MNKASAFFLVGPTASGKSDIAHILAKKDSLDIISADSMNIYKGMDIGTAKPSHLDQVAYNYIGINLIDPVENFSVVDWMNSIKYTWKKQHVPIVVGGTGLYIKCLTIGMDESEPKNELLRDELDRSSLEELQQHIQNEMPDLFNQLTEDDQQNPRRLIRLIERGSIGSRWNQKYPLGMVGLHIEREVLHQRIANRVELMYQQGLLEEAEVLYKQNLSQTAKQAIGYAEAFDVLEGKSSEKEAIEKTIIRTRQLAKRQMTWLRNQLDVTWVNVASYPSDIEVAEAVRQIWQEHGPSEVVL